MFYNYLVILLRHFLKHPTSYLINFLGLTFGFTTCLLSYMHINYEYSFDDFHSNAKNIYRIAYSGEDDKISWIKGPAPLPELLKSRIPDIEDYTRFNQITWSQTVTVEAESKFFTESYFMMADPSFFQIFDFPLIKGKKGEVLSGSNDIVISQSTANKLFGTENPIGKIIRLTDNDLLFQVSGIMRDWPSNSHIKADYLISFTNLEKLFGKGRENAWGEYNYFIYLQLKNGANKPVVESYIKEMAVKTANNDNITFENTVLQPMKDIHFEHNRGNQLLSYDKKYIYVFLTLAISVLIISLMNYFNLTSMLSLKRIKEIGLRKSLGAHDSQLINQMVIENVVFSIVAMLLSFGLIYIMMPSIASILDIEFLSNWLEPRLILIAIIVSLFVGVISGANLAFYVSKQKAGDILKGNLRGGSDKVSFQYSLIFIQFSLSIILIISSTLISRQMQLMHNKELGFDYNYAVNIDLSKGWEPGKLEYLKTELKNLPGVDAVALSDYKPGYSNWHQTTWWESQVEPVSMNVITVGQEWFATMGVTLVEGTYEQIESSTQIEYILNRSALKLIGWETGKGKLLSPFGEKRKRPLIATVEDFNYKSLHNNIEPLVLAVYPERSFSKLTVNLNKDNLSGSLKKVEEFYVELAQGYPFNYSFIDSELDKLYKNEIRLNNVSMVLTIISIILALLGIFSLVSFSLEKRTKELAIRKVLGIDTIGLIKILTFNYLKILLYSSFIAIPVVYYFINLWLQNFSYQIKIDSIWFVLGIGIMVASVILIGLVKLITIQKINPSRVLHD